jgi:hypothetical protein
MEVVRLNSNVPIKAIPEEELNRIIIDEFTEWLANLLSLTDETSADRLESALPAVKEHCWSMGFAEIKKMFEMYADNKLSIKPIPNYFDRILFGKIVEAYKQQRKPNKPLIEKPMISENEIEENAKANILLAFDEWAEKGKIPQKYFTAFDRLVEKGIIKGPDHSEGVKKYFEMELKRAYWMIVRPLHKKYEWCQKESLTDTPEGTVLNDRLKEFKKQGFNHIEVQKQMRVFVLAKYFEKIETKAALLKNL